MKKPFVLLWGSVAALFVFAWVYLPALSKYQDLKTRKEGMDIQVRDLEKKVAEAREERDLLKNDPEYLEKVIRGELGLVKPGEVVYKFVEEKPEDVKEPVAAEEATPDVPAQNAAPAAPKDSKGITLVARPVAPKTTAPAVAKSGTAKATTVVTVPVPQSSEPVYPRRETR